MVVFEKLRQAERKINMASTKAPYVAESSGRSYRPLFGISPITAFSCNEISLKPAAFQSNLALFWMGKYFSNDFEIIATSDFLGIRKKAASTIHDQLSGAIFDPSPCK